ncbi:MAG TPA: hypothetical protein VH164_12280 [Ktedonobacteraceae bacterium]|nr:hypothetical protein [Ktedonobacteraceae bacterium]
MRIDAEDVQQKQQIDALNPPIEYPLLKGLFGAAGALGGATLGSGGVFFNVPGEVIGGAIGTAAGIQAYNAFQNMMDSISGTKNDQGQPITPTQEMLDALKGGLMVFGGGLGQAAGRTAGTVASMAGGALGTAGATFTADQVAAIGKLWNIIPEDERTPDMRDSVIDAVVNGGLDLAINMAGKGMKLGTLSLAHSIFGIGPKEIEATAIAAKYGIQLAPNNLSESGIGNLYRNLMTRLVPMLASPYKKRFAKQLIEGHQAVSGMAVRTAGGTPLTST